MPLFFKSNDVNLINSLNVEIINNIIDTTINLYKTSAYDTEGNLYGEAPDKLYYPAVNAAGLIEHDDESFEDEDFGPDMEQPIIVKFHRKTLQDISLYPEIGDIIDYNDRYYEISEVVDNQFLGGQVSLKHSILCKCHITKKDRVDIEEINKTIDTEHSAVDMVDSIYD